MGPGSGGGTGGHTSPGLAVAARLREMGVEVHWIGSRRGIEARRVPEAGVPFYTIPVGKLRRYWDWQNVPDLAVRARNQFGDQPELKLSFGFILCAPAKVAVVTPTGADQVRPPAVIDAESALRRALGR